MKVIFHLAGLHKLFDVKHLMRGSRTRLFNELLINDILCPKIEKSSYYGDISMRLELCLAIKSVLDSKIDVFSYKKNASGFSKIQADFYY